MKKKNRIIFELDDTVLCGKALISREFFERIYREESFKICDSLERLIGQYEKRHRVFDYSLLSKFLSNETSLDISPDIIREWDAYIGNGTYYMEDGTLELLEGLKRRGISLAILTNWFRDSQLKKMDRYSLSELFDDIYTGEGIIKPHDGAFQNAMIGYDKDNCIFVGNDLDNDYIGPRRVGVDSLLLDRHDVHHESVVKVKKLDEVRKVVE